MYPLPGHLLGPADPQHNTARA